MQFKTPKNLINQKQNLRKAQSKDLLKLKGEADKVRTEKQLNFENFINSLPESNRSVIREICIFQMNKVRKSISEVHEKKIKNLQRYQQAYVKIAKRRRLENVINLSSYKLTQTEKHILALGFSMCWPFYKDFIQKEKAEAERVAHMMKTRC